MLVYAHGRRTCTEHDNQQYKDFIFFVFECVWFFFHSLFLSGANILVRVCIRTTNSPFLQMFVGSCAHININTSANAPHNKSAGTCCLIAFLHNYKAAHCDVFFSFFVSYASFTRHIHVRCSLCFMYMVGWLCKGSAALDCGKNIVFFVSSFNFSPNFCRLLNRSVSHRTVHNSSMVIGVGKRRVEGV